MATEHSAPSHIRLTSHPVEGAYGALPVHWGQLDPHVRGPIVGSTANRSQRNVIGTHSGSYGVYRALAVAAGALMRGHKPDLTNTMPTDPIGPYPQWGDPLTIVSMDPFGAVVAEAFKDEIAQGYDVRPTIAVTKAHIDMPEVRHAMAAGRLQADGKILLANGSAVVTKAAIEPVWWLEGVAKRFRCSDADLRRALFEETGGMYPELVTRSDLGIFLPPIGGQTVYIFGQPRDLANPNVTLTARVHDECNGSDVFGSDICTCRPYLTHAIEECIRGAQQGGVGVVVYSRKEGRALGEVTKFLVYNARKRQEGGDSASNYFLRTECVAGGAERGGSPAGSEGGAGPRPSQRLPGEGSLCAPLRADPPPPQRRSRTRGRRNASPLSRFEHSLSQPLASFPSRWHRSHRRARSRIGGLRFGGVRPRPDRSCRRQCAARCRCGSGMALRRARDRHALHAF